MLAYVDESGQPHPNDPNPCSALVALCIDERLHRGLSAGLHSIKRNLLPHRQMPFELKAKAVMNRRTFERVPEKREFVESVFDLIMRSDVVIFSILMSRPSKLPTTPPGHLARHCAFLLQRIDALAKIKDEYALLIYDGQGRNIQGVDLSTAISNYCFNYAYPREQLTRLIDTPHFVDSVVTPGVQLTDYIAYAVRAYSENEPYKSVPEGDPYLSAIARYRGIALSKTRNDLLAPWGDPLFGFYNFREELFYEEEEEEIEPEVR